jgi:ABC-type Fe3+-hydroxamate transport system substrate-binding protein
VRIISLVPSATETILAWGVLPIAVTRFCERGDEFPTVGGTKDPRIQEIIAMQPDLVVMCDQENRLPDAEALTAANVPIHRIHITDVDHVLPEMESLAKVLGVPASIARQCAPVPPQRAKTPRRAYIPIWKRPWMTLNEQTYATSLLAALGIDTIAYGAPPYPEMDLEQAAAHQPDLVIAPNEPYVFSERHRAELETVAPVVFVDGKDLFWWGTRTPDGMTRLADQLRHVE